MRVPPLMIFGILFLAASAASAQDLQYRVRMTMTMPGQDVATRSSESAMYIKGSRIRADSKAGGAEQSVIVDAAAGKLYAVNHAERTYQELPTDLAADSALLQGDTARLRALGILPEVIKTSEKRTILGYQTARVVTVARNPGPGDAGAAARTVVVSDSWISQDPKLMEAFRASMQVAQKMMGGAAQQIMSLVPPEAIGVPLRTTTLILRREPDAPIDALAILEQADPQGLLMRVEMEPIEVELVLLPDSLFRVPAGYTKVD